MVPAQQRHDDSAASLFTLELRRSTRSAEDDPIPNRRACDGHASRRPPGVAPAAAVAQSAAGGSSTPRGNRVADREPRQIVHLAARMGVIGRKPRRAPQLQDRRTGSSRPRRSEVSRASCIARRNRTMHGDPGSNGREAMVSADQQNLRCRLAPALELRRSTRSAEEDRNPFSGPETARPPGLAVAVPRGLGDA